MLSCSDLEDDLLSTTVDLDSSLIYLANQTAVIVRYAQHPPVDYVKLLQKRLHDRLLC